MNEASLVFTYIHNGGLFLLRIEIFCAIPKSAYVQIWLQLTIPAFPALWLVWVEI